MALMAAMMMSVCDSTRSILSSRWKYLRFMSWGIRGPALISLYFYEESTSGWRHGWHEILSRALREADSVCHSWTQTVSECWSVGHQHLEGAASSRLDMKGWSRGKWLSNSRCWINQRLSVYWLRPKCATSRNISRSWTFSFEAIISLW